MKTARINVIKSHVKVDERVFDHQAPEWMPTRMIRFLNFFRRRMNLAPLTIPLSRYKLKIQEVKNIHFADIDNEIMKSLINEIENK